MAPTIHEGWPHMAPTIHDGLPHMVPVIHEGLSHMAPTIHEGWPHMVPIKHDGLPHMVPIIHDGLPHMAPIIHDGLPHVYYFCQMLLITWFQSFHLKTSTSLVYSVDIIFYSSNFYFSVVSFFLLLILPYINLKVFDKVKHNKMLEIMNRINIDGKDLRIIKNLYWEQTAAVRIDNEIGPFQQIKRGVRQGCIISPDLFSLYIEIIMRHITDMPEISIGGT
jgi:hypothetical protein